MIGPGRLAIIVILCASKAVAAIPAPRTPNAALRLAAKRPNILLITLDTMRQDAIGCYRDPTKEYPSIGWKPGMASATPVLDALCARGRRFTRAYTTAPITLPAHASILTGLYPTRHGIHDNGIYTLPKDVPTLPEILKKNGYQTAAAVSAIVLDRHYGLNRGFDQYDDQLGPRGSGLQLEERKATQTVDAALKLMAGMKKGKPWFFWLHLYDPHNDYQAPEPYKSKYSAYMAEVAYMDHELGRFLETVKKNGQINDDTLIIATGDHGESLGEHGEATHGIFLYDSTLKVPMIFSGNHLSPDVFDLYAVSIQQIMPTLLSRTGVTSFTSDEKNRLLDGRTPNGTNIYSESELGSNSYHWAPLYSVIAANIAMNLVDNNWTKFIDASKPELYDLAHDSNETRNLHSVSHEDQIDFSVNVLKRYRTKARKPTTQSDDPEARKALMQLGYVSGPSQANDKLPRPDPKDVIHLLPLFDKARGMAGQGHCQQAIPDLQNILKQNPGNVPVMAQLGWCQIELKNPRAAIPLYAGAIKLRPDWDILHYQLGSALLQVDDKPGAEREWKAALALNPRFTPAAASLIQSARLAGRSADAEKALAAARKAQLEDSDLEGEAGLLALVRGDLPGAEKAFLAALRLDPKNVSARANLATLYYQRREIPGTLKLYEAGIALLPGEGQFLKPAAAILLEECPDARVCSGAAQAARYFRQYLERNPGAPDAPQVREILGDLEAARH